MRVSTYSREFELMLGGGPLEGTFELYTHLSLLKALWKEWSDRMRLYCLLPSFQEDPHQKIFFKEKTFNFPKYLYYTLNVTCHLSGMDICIGLSCSKSVKASNWHQLKIFSLL